MVGILRQTQKKGIFGIPIAYGNSTEEQGRKILHGHMLIWIKNFNKLQDLLYHPDESIRKKALQELQKYIEKILSSSYGDVVIWAFFLWKIDPEKLFKCDEDLLKLKLIERKNIENTKKNISL